MTEIARIEGQPPKLPSLHAGGAVRAIIPQDFDGVWRIATAVVKAGMAPRGLDKPEQAMVAILHGMEVGLTPMAALQSIAVVNGRPTIWGDGALGLVQGSGKMESFKEWYEGQGESRKALCQVKRRGDPELKLGEFSVADAKKASLWGKQGPWTQYSDRMLKMRARAFALRDGFSDVLRGLGIAEEVQDTPIQIASPPSPPSPPSPRTIEHQAKPVEKPAGERSVSSSGDEPSEPVDASQGEPEPADDGLPPIRDYDAQIEDWIGQIATAEDAGILGEVWSTIEDYLTEPGRHVLPPDIDRLRKAHEAKQEHLA